MSIGNVMQHTLDVINQSYPLTEKSVGEFAKVKAKGMTFLIRQYEAKGLGNVSVMEAKGFFGLMQMDTLIVNPLEKDLPLYSYDRILAMGNDTLIIELYDTLLEKRDLAEIQKIKNDYRDLPEHELGEHWYDSIKLPESVSKKGKKEHSASFDKLAKAYFQTFLAGSSAQEPEAANTVSADGGIVADTGNCDIAAKRQKASVYVEGLLSNGGPSTDVFKKEFGEGKTACLFRNILFGTGEK